MKIFKSIFNASVLILIIISLWPGSLIGYIIYNDLSRQPDIIQNPLGTSINHFISYFCVSLLGLLAYLKTENLNKLVYGLFFLSVTLEFFHLIIPNRSFQLTDLLSNIFGVAVAYLGIKIYLLFNKS